jgi:DNA polymerase-3 subunit chi
VSKAAVKIEFHSGVPDKLDHACRLLRKAQAAGAKVVVAAEPALLDRLDAMLWTFDALSFVPHVRVRAAGTLPAAAARTPIWLTDVPQASTPDDVLVNLGTPMVPGWQGFARVIEIVGADDADSQPARERWRTYAEQPGVELVHHARGAGA